MRKIFPILLLAVLLFSCCSDSKNDILVPEPPGVGQDAKLIGKWRVISAKYIVPAVYAENEEEVALFSKTADYVKAVGWNFGSQRITESYNGADELPITGVFVNGEIMIEIKEDNTIDVIIGTPSVTIDQQKCAYSIDDQGRLLWRKYENDGYSWGRNYYYIDSKGDLHMELRGNINADYPLEKYRASVYRRVQ